MVGVDAVGLHEISKRQFCRIVFLVGLGIEHQVPKPDGPGTTSTGWDTPRVLRHDFLHGVKLARLEFGAITSII